MIAGPVHPPVRLRIIEILVLSTYIGAMKTLRDCGI